jgi:predicted transcriptional regulator
VADRLQDLATEFNELREESTYLRKRLAKIGPRVTELRPLLAEAIVDAVKAGRAQVEISRITGYTPERIRQICRAAGVEPPE